MKKARGITLIALVVTIIIMLILAGVSLNAITGDGGLIAKTMKAKEISQRTSELENLQIALMGYNIKNYSDQKDAIDDVINGIMEKELIDWVDGIKDTDGNIIDYNRYEDENGNLYMWAKKGENSYRIFVNSDNSYWADIMPVTGGGTLKGGTYLVTKDAFNSGAGLADPNERGKFTIEGNTKVVFNEPLGVDSEGNPNGDMLSIHVLSGSNAKIYFNYNQDKVATDGKTHYLLTNKGLSRSAIDIDNGGELEIVVSENSVVTVDSGLGKGADENNNPGKGGFAGIHVPGADKDVNNDGYITIDDIQENSGRYNCAVLTLSGQGKIVCTGGNAGEGALFTGVNDAGGAGGGGAGAGIGRKWWKWRKWC